MRNRILMSLLLAAACALPAWSQGLPSASMLGPSTGKVPSHMALRWVYVIRVETVDEAAIEQVGNLFSEQGFSIERARTERSGMPALWTIAGNKEYAVRTTKADLVLAEVKKAIAADTASFSWTMTPVLVPKRR